MHIKPWKLVVALLAGIFIPYFTALFFRGQSTAVSVQPDQNSRNIVVDGQPVELEEYLIRLTAAQIPADYHIEALKAQAVIARTYLYQAVNAGESVEEKSLAAEGWTEKQMKEAWQDQTDARYTKIRQAVQQTKGQVLIYQGTLIDALYHRVSSGTTRTDVSNSCPYLKSKESSWDIQAPNYLQMKIMTQEEFVQTLQNAFPDRTIGGENVIATIQILSKDSSGYIELMQIGGWEFQGIQVANAFGLTSACMSFEEYEDKLRILCRGIGHGYGMSQWGASQMGGEGTGYRDILTYYYDGAEVAAG